MSVPRYRPRRRLRSEVFPVLAVLALIAALYAAFPSGAVNFQPRKGVAPVTVYNAFVSLDVEREAELLAAARSSWQSDSASRRGIRANLLSCGGAGDESPVASGLCPPIRSAEEAVVDYECDIVPSGVAADAPTVLASENDVSVREPAFSKADLLKLN